MTNLGRQDGYSSSHITSMPPLPLCSILQNPGKTAVLLVLPLMEALGTGENIFVFYQFYSISEVKQHTVGQISQKCKEISNLR